MSRLGRAVEWAGLDAWRPSLSRPATVAGCLAAVLLPLVVGHNSYFMLVLCLIGIYVIVVTGLDILYGLSGQVSLGHAAFFAIGAYTAAILSTQLGWSFWLVLPLAGLLAMLVAVVIAVPSVRLVHHFLALVTIGLGEIVQLTLFNTPAITRGYQGISRIPPPQIAGFALDSYVALYYLILPLTVLGVWLKRNLTASRWGRRFLSVRENPRAAEAFGTPLLWTRTLAFVLSAAYAAVGGVLFAHLITYVSPDTFDFRQSTLFLTMVLIGGYGTLWGPVLGVAGLTFLTEYGQQFELFQGIFYGLAIIAVVALLPRGVVGSLEDLYREHVRAPERRAGRGATIVGAAQPLQPTRSTHPTLSERAPREPGTPPRLAVTGIRKSFGGLQAVAGVDLEVMPNEIVSIIGPNGSGKTTLFNLITGFVASDAGSVRVDGKEIAGLRPDQICRVGLDRTFQSLELFPRLSVLDHLRIGMQTRLRAGLCASLLGLPGARREDREAEQRAREILHVFREQLTLDRLLDRADSLSYANRRRLEIARALAAEPRLLLLDEPTAGMNPHESRELMETLARLRNQGHTILLIEHDMAVVVGISDRVVALDHGEKIAEGPPAEVMRHPRVVEAYLGG